MRFLRRTISVVAFSSALFIAIETLSAQTTQPAEQAPAVEPSYNPIPRRLIWPGIVIIILIGMFVTAALAGPLIRANEDDEESSDPPSQSS